MARGVRFGSYPPSAAKSFGVRPSTPPASLIRLKAASIPSFIWRPSSFAGPENGAAIPNRISRSVTPRTCGPAAATATGAVGAVAAAAEDGAITADRLRPGPGPGPAVQPSRSADRAAPGPQANPPVVHAVLPSA